MTKRERRKRATEAVTAALQLSLIVETHQLTVDDIRDVFRGVATGGPTYTTKALRTVADALEFPTDGGADADSFKLNPGGKFA